MKARLFYWLTTRMSLKLKDADGFAFVSVSFGELSSGAVERLLHLKVHVGLPRAQMDVAKEDTLE